jgi:hypothetical protein
VLTDNGWSTGHHFYRLFCSRGQREAHRLPHHRVDGPHAVFSRSEPSPWLEGTAVTARTLPPIRHDTSRWVCSPAPGGHEDVTCTRRETHAVDPPLQRLR